MIESFKATVVSIHEDDEFIVVGLGQSSSDSYLMFQRSLPIGSDDDFGVYLEFDEESNSAYDAVTLCGLGRTRLVAELGDSIGPGGAIGGFAVELAVSDEQHSRLVEALSRIFSDAEGVLQIDDG
jgi:hypothetical protein